MKAIVVQAEDSNIRLDRWFKRNEPSLPFSMLVKLIRKGGIKVNGKKCDCSGRVLVNDIISYPALILEERGERTKSLILPNKHVEAIKKAVIYKDDDIIVINKPAGLAVQGGSKISCSVDDLANELKFDYEKKPKLVHRLDKETSGVLILARKTSVAAELSELFRTKRIIKKYLALVSGVPKPYEGKIDLALEKQKDIDNYEKSGKSEQGKKAITYYRVLDYAGDVAALVELDLITGRTHQIRAHLSLIGTPILGDDKYGNEVSRQEKKLFLHSYQTEFMFNNTQHIFKAELPAHFRDKLAFLGLGLDKKAWTKADH